MEQIFGNNPWVGVVIAIAALWSIPWKGMALWKAARASDTWWFIALLVVNTVGVLDILYIYIFSKWKWHQSENAPTLPTIQQ